MGCGGSKQAVAPSKGDAPQGTVESGTMKRGQSKLQPFQSKPRMAADGSIIPTSVTVGSTQKRGSVTVAHGLSFTEVARPADQVISLAVEKDVKEGAAGADGTVDVEGLAGEVEADRVEYSEEDEEARIGGLVLEATKRGVVSVLDLMRKEADNPMFQWWCSDAIASLCAGNDEARALAGASGAVELVVDAFKRFSGEETVVVKGCWAMAILAADHADALGDRGAVEAVVEAMKAQPSNYQLATLGCRVLENLVASEANLKRAVACDAAGRVRFALEDNEEDGQLVWRAQTLLKRLEMSSDAAPGP